jgi:hypothetical protein
VEVKIMRRERELINFSSTRSFNSEINLEATISVIEAEDILSKNYILYLYNDEGDEIGKFIGDTFPEAVRRAYASFGDLMIESWNKIL